MVECPARKPALIAERAVEAVEVVAEGVPVPRAALLERRHGDALDHRHHAHHVLGVAVARPRGAMEKPQLPPMIVVTPWSGDGLARRSHITWAS